jgi:gas vesicle protein
MSENSSTTKVLLALMAGAGIGAIIGAGAALLLTPNDGKTNRKLLKQKINELTDDFQDKAASLIDEIEEELDHLKSQTEEENESTESSI